LDPRINQTTRRTWTWTEDEDDGKLKDSEQIHNGKDWVAITALVPDRLYTHTAQAIDKVETSIVARLLSLRMMLVVSCCD
jgi:hypothetical protein